MACVPTTLRIVVPKDNMTTTATCIFATYCRFIAVPPWSITVCMQRQKMAPCSCHLFEGFLALSLVVLRLARAAAGRECQAPYPWRPARGSRSIEKMTSPVVSLFHLYSTGELRITNSEDFIISPLFALGQCPIVVTPVATKNIPDYFQLGTS